MKTHLLPILFVVFGLTCLTTNGYSQKTLVAYWDFNENEGTEVVDKIDGSIGTLIESTTFDDDSKEGTALLFNGSTDYVQTDYLDDMVIADNLTLMAWFKTTTLDGAQHILWVGDVNANGWGDQQEMHLTINHWNADLQNGNISMFYGSSSDTWDSSIVYFSTDANLEVDTWYHIAGVFNNLGQLDGDSELELYLDGELLTPTDWTETDFNFPNSTTSGSAILRDGWDTPFRIGASGNTANGRTFNGLIDEVRIYEGALTKEDIIAASKMEELPGGTAISDVNVSENAVYPNPSNGTFYFKNSTLFESYQVFDLGGRELLNKQVNSGNVLNLNQLQSGIYLLQLNAKDEQSVQRIVIK